MDLAFVGGGHVHMKDLNRVLLVTLPDATIGPVSSGRQCKYQSTFSRTERATLGGTQPLEVPIDSPTPTCPRGGFAVQESGHNRAPGEWGYV